MWERGEFLRVKHAIILRAEAQRSQFWAKYYSKPFDVDQPNVALSHAVKAGRVLTGSSMIPLC